MWARGRARYRRRGWQTAPFPTRHLKPPFKARRWISWPLAVSKRDAVVSDVDAPTTVPAVVAGALHGHAPRATATSTATFTARAALVSSAKSNPVSVVVVAAGSPSRNHSHEEARTCTTDPPTVAVHRRRRGRACGSRTSTASPSFPRASCLSPLGPSEAAALW